jgi:NADP-dependent 3-hydroxy acid dehydrogenase YdfG
MVVRTEAELGPVSILMNNAGVSSPATLKSYDPVAMARMRRVKSLPAMTLSRPTRLA